MPPLTPRGRGQRWLSTHRGISEDPAGSNRDHRRDGITAAQEAIGPEYVGQPWCGAWALRAARYAGVHVPTPKRWAYVPAIVADAKGKRNGLRGWIEGPPSHHDYALRHVMRGDLLVMFNAEHVGTIRELVYRGGRLLHVVTDEGNTSSGPGGSQSNGGIAARRIRYPADILGVALVDYPSA